MTFSPAPGGPTAAPNLPDIPGCRLLGLAGQGGMGLVYRAEQASPRRIVAVKVLNQATSPDKLAAFRREAETIARLEHPNILPVYGFGEAEGRPYLVLRYLAGGSVAVLIRKGPIALADAVRWVRAVAGALDFAHAHGLVHRDVKPSNILLDEAGNAYLTDFGIAAATEGAEAGAAIGSAAYMSPEQASGQRADRRSDLYSLAVSLFEMLTAEQPYTAETPLGVIVRHVSDPIPSARAINPAIPPAVDALIQRGMAKDPGARPPTAGEFARLLGQAVAAPNGPAAPATSVMEPPATLVAPAPLPAVSARRGAGPLLWVGLGLLALCLIGVLALGGGGAMVAIFSGALATATSLPTSTTPPTLTPIVFTATPPGVLLSASLADASSHFGLRPADASGEIAYSQGALRFSVLAPGAELYSTSGRVKAQEVKIEVEAQQISGAELTEFGAICRYQDADNYTAFAISGAGQYRIWQKSNGGTLRLVDWANAESLRGRGGAPHHLEVTCSNTQLTFVVDGAQLAQTDDPAPVPGDVALFAGLRGAGKLLVDFKKILVSAP